MILFHLKLALSIEVVGFSGPRGGLADPHTVDMLLYLYKLQQVQHLKFVQ